MEPLLYRQEVGTFASGIDKLAPRLLAQSGAVAHGGTAP
jgi:hypothetical protein